MLSSQRVEPIRARFRPLRSGASEATLCTDSPDALVRTDAPDVMSSGRTMNHAQTHELQLIVFDRFREQGRYAWTGRRLVIGRRTDADIRVNEPTMSGVHAEVVADDDGDGLRIRDLASLNGTQLNGERIDESPLKPGDQIQIGRARIVVTRRERTEPGTAHTAPAELRQTGDPGILDDMAGGQTLKIKLDELRESRADAMREDPRILLLAQLFEALKTAESRDEVLRETRRVLLQAFVRARVFILERATTDATGDELQHDTLEHEPVDRDSQANSAPDTESGGDGDGDGGSAEDEARWRDLDQPDEKSPSMTFVEQTVATESAILSTSLPEDRRFEAAESVRIAGIETAMAAPVRVDGEARAVLYVDRLGLPPFHLPDLNLLAIAANHVSAVLENVSRFEILERMVDERTAEIRRQAEEIQRLADAQAELLGIAAHDIRGPLTVIQGTTELLRLRVDSVEKSTLASSLELVHNAARGLSRLLSELLDAKSIESGKIRLARRAATAAELFAEALPVPRLAAEDKSIALVTEIEDESLTAHADPRRLGQAIANLLLNAVKFSEPGTRIALRACRDDERLRIEVEDQGVGIPEQEIGQIFGTFEQGEAGRQFGGSGLGLMIARRLVTLHDGELTVDSEVGVGSRFSMLLPLTPEAPATAIDGSDATAPPPAAERFPVA